MIAKGLVTRNMGLKQKHLEQNSEHTVTPISPHQEVGHGS